MQIGEIIGILSIVATVLIGILSTAATVIAIPLGALFALWYESQGYPRLEIVAGEPSDGLRQGGWRAKFLKIRVLNKPRKWLFLKREAARDCQGHITFFDSNNSQIGKTIPIRWDGAPEPLKVALSGNQLVALPEPNVVGAGRYINIQPDKSEGIAIAVRIYGDTDAYGWTIDSYYYERWRNPSVKLPPGDYTVRVKVLNDGKEYEREFAFTNPNDYDGFELID